MFNKPRFFNTYGVNSQHNAWSAKICTVSMVALKLQIYDNQEAKLSLTIRASLSNWHK